VALSVELNISSSFLLLASGASQWAVAYFSGLRGLPNPDVRKEEAAYAATACSSKSKVTWRTGERSTGMQSLKWKYLIL
jgi:hypothetical protein